MPENFTRNYSNVLNMNQKKFWKSPFLYFYSTPLPFKIIVKWTTLCNKFPRLPRQQNAKELVHFIAFQMLETFMDRAGLNLDTPITPN